MRLQGEESNMNELDASRYLKEMEAKEMEGTKFVDIEKEDINRKKKTGAIVGAAIFGVIMLLLLGVLIYAVIAESAAFFPIMIPFVIILGLLIGTVVVLVLRIREINSGEEYEARKY